MLTLGVKMLNRLFLRQSVLDVKKYEGRSVLKFIW